MMQNEIDLQHLQDCKLQYIPGFLTPEEASTLFQVLLSEVPWQADTIKVFGKTYDQPRLTALYGESGKPYTYSGITMHPYTFTPALKTLKQRVEQECDTSFTSVLLNLYRHGQDSNGWHADNERELGPEPIIASVSVGGSRYFHLKHRNLKDQKLKILLEPGSLLIMAGKTQEKWLHQIPKTKKPVEPRINLTFRKIFEKG
jgi:alkylated DNA repair dioxygenase AlkB